MTTSIQIPADATQETTFRCVKFACTLAYRHCLRRQAEVRKKNPNAKDPTAPMHPFCALECADGRAISARFGAAQVSVLSQNGFGGFQRHTPQLPAQPAEEDVMPNGVRSEPCPKCGSKATRCSCMRSGAKAPPLPPAPRGARAEGRKVLVGRVSPVEDVDALLARRDELLAQVADIESQLRVRLANEEAKLDRMRKAVAGLVTSAAAERAA